jgi:hypothetical protein
MRGWPSHRSIVNKLNKMSVSTLGRDELVGVFFGSATNAHDFFNHYLGYAFLVQDVDLASGLPDATEVVPAAGKLLVKVQSATMDESEDTLLNPDFRPVAATEPAPATMHAASADLASNMKGPLALSERGEAALPESLLRILQSIQETTQTTQQQLRELQHEVALQSQAVSNLASHIRAPEGGRSAQMASLERSRLEAELHDESIITGCPPPSLAPSSCSSARYMPGEQLHSRRSRRAVTGTRRHILRQAGSDDPDKPEKSQATLLSVVEANTW